MLACHVSQTSRQHGESVLWCAPIAPQRSMAHPRPVWRNGGESSRRDGTLMTYLMGLPPSVRVESALNRESAPTATCEAATRLRISERF